MRRRLHYCLLLAATLLATIPPVRAASLDGVEMPDVRVVSGKQLALNGIGLRSYPVLGIPIYVAGLYLERRSDSSEGILHSPEIKLLDIKFLRDVGPEDARQAWRSGFANNCQPPSCYIDPRDVDRFIEAVPPIHQGDETRMIFTAKGVDIIFNGREMGNITDRHFAETVLATFLGPAPPTPGLKRALLGAPE